MLYFELKYNGDFLRIELLNLAYPDSRLDWDRKWINSNASLKVGGFSGQFDCLLMTTDFDRFNKEFTPLYEKLDGTATFNTIEGQIEIKIKGDGIGHFEAVCRVMDFAGTGNTLEFRLNFDQTIIPELVNQLENITRTYPVT